MVPAGAEEGRYAGLLRCERLLHPEALELLSVGGHHK